MSGIEWVRSAMTGRRVPLTPEDRRLMALLRSNGRCPYRRLADKTGLSESAVRHRLTRLENHGVFRYTIITDPVAMGRLAARLRLRIGGRAAAAVASELATLAEVDFVAVVTGEWVLVIDLVCDDHEHLVRVVDAVRGTEGVLDLDLSLILHIEKSTLEW